jgi:hypothetical protein
MKTLQNPTVLLTLLNLSIIILCGVIAYFLKNPLSILGLLMLQQIPIFEEQQQEAVNDEEFVGEDIPEYDGKGNFGFNKDSDVI